MPDGDNPPVERKSDGPTPGQLAKDQEALKGILDDLQEDLRKVSTVVSTEDRRLLEEHATFVRETEQELRTAASQQRT